MKVKVTIEEVVSQTFEVDVDSLETAYDEIRTKYRSGELVVEEPTLIEANVMIGDNGGWNNLHV